MVKLKTFEAKPSVPQLEEEFAIWQTQNQQRVVVSVQIIPAGVAFTSAAWSMHVWHRSSTKDLKARPAPPMVSTR